MRNMPILISGVLLGLFGILGAGLVALSHDGTAERIARNERDALLHQLHVLVPRDQVDNDMLEDVIEVSAPEALGIDKTTVYLGRRSGEPVAAVFSPVSTPGYAGPINLIVAVRYDGTLAGVRVLSHRETPGLGDKIEEQRSDWILGFEDKSLLDPRPSDWKVKRDGGSFDQFTGATITPRTIVRGVKTALQYFDEHRLELFGVENRQEDQGNG